MGQKRTLMRLLKDWDHLLGLLIALAGFVVYAATASPTINFWDCGEFAASAHTLGIPHQPGTPLYVLVGRVFSILVPDFVGSVGYQINLMSALFASLALFFSYLTALHLLRNWYQGDRQLFPAGWPRRLAAASGAVFLAFSYTFWTSAIEAEVYALSSFTLSFVAWLGVVWYERRKAESSALLLLIVVYLMGLSVGFHLGSILVFPGIFALFMVSQDRSLRFTDFLLVSVAMGGFVLSTMKAPDWLVLILLGSALAFSLHRSITWGSGREENPHSRWFALGGILLFFTGLSVHLFMMIRAGHDPLINQSDPTTFDQLMTVLRREQYPPRSIFDREAPLVWQFGHFWGSSIWQTGSLAGRQVAGYLQQFSFTGGKLPLLDVVVPTFLWLSGLYFQARHNFRLFVGFATILLINSIGLILLLNFTDHEVRDRDYFYFGAWQFMALFISLGVGGLLSLIIEAGKPRLASMAGVIIVFLAAWPAIAGPIGFHQKWFEHDRSRNVIAVGYAKNILMGMPQNAILLTNGDNDTFPLWYLQEVEGYRTDVRVVNLSLINLPWYLKQLRDYEPKVPITWTDAQLDGEEPVRYRNFERIKLEAQYISKDKIVWIRDMAVWHIAMENRWERDIYYAVTVPDENIGDFLPYLEMQGMVWKLTPEKSEDGNPRVNIDAIWKNYSELYEFESVLNAEGYADTTIFRDAQTTHLLRNYPASLSRVGYYAATDREDYDLAIAALEMAYRFEPDFPLVLELLPAIYLKAGNVDGAIDMGRRLMNRLADPVDPAMGIVEMLSSVEQHDAAIRWARELREMRPTEGMFVRSLAKAQLMAGQDLEAEATIQAWVDQTGDVALERQLQEIRARRLREGGL